jgi:hypothetical protein
MKSSSGKSSAGILFVLKLVLLFFSAHAVNTILHELSHALMACALGIRSTMFHLFVNPDLAHARQTEIILVAAIGPIFSLGLGTLSWVAYRKSRTLTLKLLMLYSATFGISIFLGNLFSTAFAGDFNAVANAAGIPFAIRSAATAIGLMLLVGFMYRMGGQFVSFGLSLEGGKMKAVAATTVLPALLGTGVMILAYLPLPINLIIGMMGECFFWLFAAIGGYRSLNPNIVPGPTALPSLHWLDITLALITLGIVRVMLTGINFTP